MLFLLIIISIIFIKIGMEKDDQFVIGLSAVALGFTIIITFIMLVEYPYNGETKLECYKQKNEEIEIQIRNTLTQNGEYIDINNMNINLLVNMYPYNQMTEYKENLEKIEELEDKMLSISIYRFWLYFGH